MKKSLKFDDLKNVICSFSLLVKLHKPYFLYAVIGVILMIVQPFILILFPRYIINELTESQNISLIIKYVLAMGGALLFTNGVNAFVQEKQEQHANILMNKIGLYVGDVSMRMELSDLEQSANSDKIEMAKQSMNSVDAIQHIVNIVSQVLTVVGLVIIISSYNILLFLAALVVLAVKLFSQYKANQSWAKCRAQAMPYERKGAYLQSYIIDHSGAKEVRLHNLKEWMYAKCVALSDESNRLFLKNFKITAVYNVIAHLIFELQVLFYYVVLIHAVTNHQISIGDFVMYITTITTLSVSLNSVADSATAIQKSMIYLRDFWELNQFKHKVPENISVDTAEYPKQFDIEFRNVSFRYPGSDSDVLKNINIYIPAGQHLAIVGPNGAGKSTFIKLLCGFYRPTSGEILIGGMDISQMPHETLMECIGAVYQDFQMFAFRIVDNIVMARQIDVDLIQRILNQLSLKERIDILPQGIETYLYKDFDENGVELSGGQMQKLAIARSLYKSPAILILDEPTANLDALIEYEIYQNLRDISRNKTSIFISHRLASTRFSDIIAVFSDGEIVEYGSHNDLIQHNGVYAEMFEKQSRYYNQ